MDSPIQINAIRMGLSIIYFKGSEVGISKLWSISVSQDCFDLSKKCRPRWNAAICCISSWPSLFAKCRAASAVGNVSGYRCVSDCRSRGGEFHPGPVPYFRNCGDWSWNNFYGHSPPFRWFIQEGLLSVTSESMCTNYWLTDCSSLPRKSVLRWTDCPPMTIAVDLGRKARKQTNKQKLFAKVPYSGFQNTKG